MNRYEDFDLGQFKSVFDIKPKSLADGFFLQMRALLEQRKYIRHKYTEEWKHIGFNRDDPTFAEADAIAYKEEAKLRNDDQGSTWLAGIIAQRKKLVEQEEAKAFQAHKESKAYDEMLEQRRKDDCEWGMIQSAKIDEAREKEQEAHDNRVNSANAERQVYVYKRRKRRELRAQRAAMYRNAEKSKK